MRYLVQDSLDNGKTWRCLSVLGFPVEFKGKAEAKKWFMAFEEANNIDWRVGFLICTRSGSHYRLVTKKTGEPVATINDHFPEAYEDAPLTEEDMARGKAGFDKHFPK